MRFGRIAPNVSPRNAFGRFPIVDRQLSPGDHVSGMYRERVIFSSGSDTMIDDGMGFQLVL
jgi:hypothetical protein